MGVSGIWHVKHIRDGKTLNEFKTPNAITRRGAFDIFIRFAQVTGVPGGVAELEGGTIQDFISTFGWGGWFIEQEGDGVLNNGGDFDSGRGLHRDDRVRYWDQGNSGVTVAADNREWDGDLHSIFNDSPRLNNTQATGATHYNDGIVFPPSLLDLPRNIFSMEHHNTYRAVNGPRSFRGIWWFQYRNTSGFGQSSVVSSALFPEVLNMRKFDFLELIYQLKFTNTVVT